MIFSPVKLPKDYTYPFKNKFEERNYEVEKNVWINSILFKSNLSNGLVFYIHGNADNLRYWGDYANFFLEHNYDVFMYDFRGFGKSDGRIRSEKKMHRDAMILYEQMVKEYDEEQIIIYGFSLGTGIAAKLASEKSQKTLILEAPFFNFISLVKYHKAYLPAKLISKYKFRINRFIKKVKSPIYIYHGTDDRKVPYYLGERLIGLNKRMKFVEITGAAHNDMQNMELFKKEMKEVLR